MAPHQGFVGVEIAARESNDGLKRNPQRALRALERGFDARSIRRDRPLAKVGERFALDPGERMQALPVVNDVEQLAREDRLHQVPHGSELYRLDCGVDIGKPGDENHGHVEVALTNRTQQFDAAHLRHRDIADDHIERLALEYPFRAFAIRRTSNLEPGIGEDTAEQVEHTGIVVDQ